MAENKIAAASEAPPDEKMHITPLMRKIWGIGVFGEGFNMQPQQLYGMFFATDVIGVTPAVLAATNAVSSIARLFLAPIGGALVDGTKPMRWGKLRSWLLIGSIISFAFAWFPWVQKGTPTTHQWINLFVGLLTGAFYNAQVIATFSLVPSMCFYDEERHTLASNQMTGNKLGVLLAGFLVPLVMTSFMIPAFGDRASYVMIGVVCNAVMFVTYMVHFKLSKGFEGNGMIIEKAAKEKLSLKDAVAAIRAVPSLLAMIFADITSTVGAFLLPPFVVYLYKLVINDGNSFGMMPIHNLCIGIAGVIGSFTARYWLRKVKNKKNICLILYPCIALSIFCARFFTDNVFMFIFCVALAMFFQGTTNPVENTFYYDMAIVAQAKMGKDPTPTLIAIQQFGPGIAGIISSNVLSLTLLAMSYDPDAATTAAVKAGFINGYSLVPGIVCVAGWIALFFFYKITPKKVAEARAIVRARGEALVKEKALGN
jgi:GPH family glycoside/pentoside/hexuronide:cation symporter